MNYLDLHYLRVMRPAIAQEWRDVKIHDEVRRVRVFLPRPPEYTYVERPDKTQHNRKVTA